MKISKAIQSLSDLLRRYGDISVEADCSHCGKSYSPDYVVIAPPTARLQTKDHG